LDAFRGMLWDACHQRCLDWSTNATQSKRLRVL
jgi:hypothetical protein